MIRAVFFDWFHTLARFDPPREQLYCQAFLKSGIKLSPEAIMHSILIADQYFFAENTKSPIADRNPEEQLSVYIKYPQTILNEAKINAPKELCIEVIKNVRENFTNVAFSLFDDVLLTLKDLKQQKLTLGLLTNLDSDMVSICRNLGLEAYIDFMVTAKEAGADKPNPPIFLAALVKAETNAQEAIHVGDQYNFDVVGARNVGINPILIDRYDTHPEVSDCPQIHSLTEISQYL
ncbi:MAG: HAD-IA family hydrolase [Dehalococcoidales bacterium]|nr:HAD-IA family hydrolase [Dehalococcoidales bacterium]